ncbi:MAG: hypothetical protein ACR2IE_03775 [Candidatus Sumerlaeaceae bacterium]
MPRTAIIFGIILIFLGIATYAGTRAPTALIPAAFGILFIVCGFVARNPAMLKHAMHAAAMLALLGFVMPAVMVIKKVSSGAADFSNPAVSAQTAMAAICAVFLVTCVRSFIAARKARDAASSTTAV